LSFTRRRRDVFLTTKHHQTSRNSLQVTTQKNFLSHAEGTEIAEFLFNTEQAKHAKTLNFKKPNMAENGVSNMNRGWCFGFVDFAF